jgi:beta-lactamase class A
MRILLPLIALLPLFWACENKSPQSNSTPPPVDSTAQAPAHAALRARLDSITGNYPATVGIAVMHLEGRDTLTLNNSHHYPMQSVYKLPLGMAVLKQVDEGKWTLDQKVKVTPKELLRNTWSPARDKYPKGADLTLEELLDFTVSQSDNNTCDVLFRLMGGCAKVDSMIHGMGIKAMNIVYTEEEMAKEWERQYTNWVEPMALVQIMDGLHHHKLLSDSSTNFLMGLMVQSPTGPKRIKGLLPEGTVVAHKTGTGSQNPEGLISATNDTGIITLPDGKHVALAVLVSDAKGKTYDDNERVIAEVALAVYEEFSAVH